MNIFAARSKSLILGLVFVSAAAFSAVFQTTPSVSKEELLADLRFMIEKAEEAHPDPYRLITREDFRKAVQGIEHTIRQNKQNHFSTLECFYLLQEVASLIQDEHTTITFPDMALKNEKIYFPHMVKVIGNKVFSTKNLIDSEIPEMTELLGINGVPVITIKEECRKLIQFPLPHAKNYIFERIFGLYLTGYFRLTAPWTISFRSGTRVETRTSPGTTLAALRKAFRLTGEYRKYTITAGLEDIPVLDIPSFSYGRFEDYRRFVDDFFRENSNKKAVVIDIRKNPGGNGTWAYYLMDHFAQSIYPILEKFEFKVSELFKRSSYASKAGGGVFSAENGTYLPLPGDNMRTPVYRGEKFEGQVYLLTSHATNSAGVVMAAIFKNAHMGTVIGQETAGRIEFSSDPVKISMPNTGLSFIVPVAIYALPGDDPDRGVSPDIQIEYSIKDVKESRDKEIDYVRKLVLELH
ncbi:S41 family peptidase [Acidobacteriota bacterium]